MLDNNGNTVDSVTWATDDAKPSIQRCANGTGGFVTSTTATRGSANSCGATSSPTSSPSTSPTSSPTGRPTGGPTSSPTTGSLLGGGGSLTKNCAPEAPSGSGSAPSGAVAWPGGLNVTIADNVCEFQTSLDAPGTDMSGLAFDPTNPSVLWAVSNKSWVFKLVRSGSLWVPDSSWSATGKEIYFSGGKGQPDSEGITVAPNSHLYITCERDNANNDDPLDTITEFDPTASGSTLKPLHEWDMTSQFPQLEAGDKDAANAGFEGVAYVPDSSLTALGWRDPNTGMAYNPATYTLHGSGLFFAGLEDNGDVYVYGLDSDGSTTTFGSFSSGTSSLSDVSYDAATQRRSDAATDRALRQHLRGGRHADEGQRRVLREGRRRESSGGAAGRQPGGLRHRAELDLRRRSREAVWSDDGIYGSGKGGAGYGHALYSSTFPCS